MKVKRLMMLMQLSSWAVESITSASDADVSGPHDSADAPAGLVPRSSTGTAEPRPAVNGNGRRTRRLAGRWPGTDRSPVGADEEWAGRLGCPGCRGGTGTAPRGSGGPEGPQRGVLDHQVRRGLEGRAVPTAAAAQTPSSHRAAAAAAVFGPPPVDRNLGQVRRTHKDRP